MSINNVSGVRSDINEMLSKIREISNKSKVFSENSSVTPGVNAPKSASFQETMSAVKDVFSNVNNIQIESEKVKDAYLSGDKHVSMSQVLIASQKSKLAFEGLVTVRNKILEAYKEIMNMPV
ncbi:Flagellar hook-basal body complex protein FliE [Aquicella siphonis]|uniref:Flagellar hook-basal body complex protein FliE n=1 Tax=Aquicella siphonis TaxID=254247 RepID=A0A5E4PLK1_9COXI|nr:flagellar hook-basal body complex protein FliE [Aquicella siphonis]VVC77106.1 Flagellar hook-basal body complex protein FliE [Aquicella siphonis]